MLNFLRTCGLALAINFLCGMGVALAQQDAIPKVCYLKSSQPCNLTCQQETEKPADFCTSKGINPKYAAKLETYQAMLPVKWRVLPEQTCEHRKNEKGNGYSTCIDAVCNQVWHLVEYAERLVAAVNIAGARGLRTCDKTDDEGKLVRGGPVFLSLDIIKDLAPTLIERFIVTQGYNDEDVRKQGPKLFDRAFTTQICYKEPMSGILIAVRVGACVDLKGPTKK